MNDWANHVVFQEYYTTHAARQLEHCLATGTLLGNWNAAWQLGHRVPRIQNLYQWDSMSHILTMYHSRGGGTQLIFTNPN